MKRGFIIALILVLVIVIVIAVIIGIIILSDNNGNGDDVNPPVSENTQCTELGCSSNAYYVGSINSDKYYECSCRWAKNINPENIICFNSEQEAKDKGYVRSEC